MSDEMFVFEVEVDVSHSETFDLEREDFENEEKARESAERLAESLVRDDLRGAEVDFDMDVTATLKETL